MANVYLSRLKLLTLVFFSTVIIFVKDLRILIFLFFSLLTIITVFRLKNRLFPRITSLLAIGLLVILFNLIFNTTQVLTGRFIMGMAAATRIIILSILVFLYTSLTSPSEIVSALSFLPKNIQLMLTITFSLIPQIIQESQKIMLVQSAKGYNSKSFNIARSVIPLIIPLIHRTLQRAGQITLVLQTRGFHET